MIVVLPGQTHLLFSIIVSRVNVSMIKTVCINYKYDFLRMASLSIFRVFLIEKIYVCRKVVSAFKSHQGTGKTWNYSFAIKIRIKRTCTPSQTSKWFSRDLTNFEINQQSIKPVIGM